MKSCVVSKIGTKWSWRIYRITVRIIICLTVTGCLSRCRKELDSNIEKQKNVSFMVLSDIHYFDPTLFTLPASTDFQADLASDRKMIVESSAILKKALAAVETEKPDFLLITGDLTKDGEKTNHQILANMFKQLSDKGIKVLVIPGNHDVNNPYSCGYLQSSKAGIDNINQDDFAFIYSCCGYSGAADRDPNSLSYVSEPVPGTWILGIDACHYAPVVETAGSIKSATISWISYVVAKAKKKNKTLIAMMHHSLAEHFTDESILFPGYVADDWKNISAALTGLGIKIVFTGHFHANDIVRRNSNSGYIYDIETGSTVTYPCAYRKVRLNTLTEQMKVETGYITDVTFITIPQGTEFRTYARNLLNTAAKDLLTSTLTAAPFNIPAPTIKTSGLDRIFSNAIEAHFAGDETPDINDISDIQLVKMISPILGGVLQNIWSDIPPSDCNLTINLATGTEMKN